MIIADKPNKTRYTFTLDSNVVKEAEALISGFGGKLSPLVENLLKQFVENAKLSPGEMVLSQAEQIQKLKAMEEKVREQIKKLKGENYKE